MSSFDPAWEAMRQRNGEEWRRDFAGSEPASTTRADAAEAYKQALHKARSDAAQAADPDDAAYRRSVERDRAAWQQHPAATRADAESHVNDDAEHAEMYTDAAPAMVGAGLLLIDDGDRRAAMAARQANAWRNDVDADVLGEIGQ